MSEQSESARTSVPSTPVFSDTGSGTVGVIAQAPRMSGFMEKIFVNSIPPYRRAEAANPIEWAWNLIQQINRNSPSDATKEFAVRSKVDNNTLLQIDNMTREGTPRPTRWNSAWSWPVRVSLEEPYEVWVCRRIVEAAYGDPRIGHFVAQLKPTPQQPDESTSLYQLRISNIRDINSFIATIAGHLYSVPDPSTIDQYLCKEYNSTIQTKVTRMISELIEDRKRLQPNAPPYTPTVDDYRTAALQAEDAMLEFRTMINERSGGAAGINLVAATASNDTAAGNSLLTLVRPISFNVPSAPAQEAATPAGEKGKAKKEAKTPGTPGTPSEQALEKRLGKLSSTLDRLMKNAKKRSRDDDSDEEEVPRRRKGGQVLLSMKNGKGRPPAGTALRCYNCGNSDHKIGQCPQPCRPDITCPRCQKKGHFAKNCPPHNADAAVMPRNGIAEVQENAGAV